MDLLGKNIKFHKRGVAPGESELWLVSYADMMTLLFGFFVILYSISAIDESRFNDVGRQLAEAFRGDVEELKSQSEVGMLMQARQIRALQLLVAVLNLGETVEEAVDKIEKQVATQKNFAAAKAVLEEGMTTDKDSLLESLKAKITTYEDKVELAIPGGVLFRSGTADLMPEAKVGLQQIARYLHKLKDLVGVEIVGHTDSAPAASQSLYPSNWSLSSARAGAVAEELVRNGVNPKILVTRGMASYQPLFPERRPNGAWIRENMSKNRRVHIIIRKSHDQPESENK